MGFLDGRRGYDEFDKRDKEFEEKKKSFINRFWLKPEGTAKIVFLDDNPPIIDEHQVKIGGDWRNWFTCLSMVGKACPVCEAGNKSSVVAYYTVLDMTEWTDKAGNVHKNEVKLFGAKNETAKKLKRASAKMKEKGKPGLAGAVFEVYRTDGDSSNVGNDFTYEETLTTAEIKKLNDKAEVIDYETVLAPKTVEDIRRILGSNAEAESNRETGSGFGADEDVRF